MPHGDLDKELDASMDLLRNRLDATLVARLDDGDFATNLLAHLRDRSSPRLPFTPSRLPEIARLCTVHEPDEWNWEKTIADHALEDRVYGATHAYCDRFLEVDRETFDFARHEHPDPQTPHALNRTRWFGSLVYAYWLDRDRTYFDKLVDHWDFYCGKVPLDTLDPAPALHNIGRSARRPCPYHELDNSIRLTKWWWSFWLTLHAEPMSGERCCVLLARCLHLFDLVAAQGIRIHRHNFTAMQMEALYLWAGSLPEAVGMDVWRTFARTTTEASLAQAVFDDGVHWEKSTGYHAGCIRWYGGPCLVGQGWGDTWAPEYVERVREMGVFLDALVTPDGHMATLSDTDRGGSWKGPLSLLRCLFPDLALSHPVGPTFYSLWISDGKVWDAESAVAPTLVVQTFPSGGVAVIRSAPLRARSTAILDNGPTDAGHSHTDNLTVHYEALGKPVIVDPGRAVYRDDPDRRWVTRAISHNTLCIEDEPFRFEDGVTTPSEFLRLGPGDPRVEPPLTESRDGIHLVQSAFSAHRDDLQARVRRVVAMPEDDEAGWLAVIDTIEGTTSHTWTKGWLFPAETDAEACDSGFTLTLSHGGHVAFAYAAEGGLDLRQDAMFWFPDYDVKRPARWLRFSGRCAAATRAFVFCPSDGPRDVPAAGVDGASVTVRIGSGEWVLPTDLASATRRAR